MDTIPKGIIVPPTLICNKKNTRGDLRSFYFDTPPRLCLYCSHRTGTQGMTSAHTGATPQRCRSCDMRYRHMSFRIGIDLGGTKTEALLLSPDGRVILRNRQPTPRASGYGAIIDLVCAMIAEAAGQAPAHESCTIGLGIPGSIDPLTGLVRNANTTCLNGTSLRSDLERRLARAVAIDNDANCFTLAECRQGAGSGYGLVFGVIMGTGCGGGIYCNGSLIQGRNAIAGEWGHISIDPGGAACYCGNRGCVETKISGGGVEKKFKERFGRALSMREITQGYRDNDPACMQTFEEFLDDFGRALGGLISMLDPDAIILGGGLSQIDELYTLGAEKVRRHAFHHSIQTPILRNELGDSAGVFGAAWIGI